MKNKLKILIVNDDGYKARGLEILAEVLSEYDLYFSAPLTHQSAKSHSITYDSPLSIENIQISNTNYPAINVSGSPIDSLRVGIHHFNTKFDLVISGINDGYNLALDTFYSGTVAAAKEASLFGIKSLALSTENIYKLDFEVLTQWFDYFFNDLYHTDFAILNVNFPSVESRLIKGMKDAKLDNFYSKTIFKLENNKYQPLLDKEFKYNLDNGDYYWFFQNYITITKLKFWDQSNKQIKTS